MNKEQALHSFWSSFGILAFEENTVPTGDDAPEFPYITYTFAASEMGQNVLLNSSLWYRSESWVSINEKAEEVFDRIGKGGFLVRFDEGAIWLKKGSPFVQNMGDETDNLIKRKLFNISAEYLTV